MQCMSIQRMEDTEEGIEELGGAQADGGIGDRVGGVEVEGQTPRAVGSRIGRRRKEMAKEEMVKVHLLKAEGIGGGYGMTNVSTVTAPTMSKRTVRDTRSSWNHTQEGMRRRG